MREADSEQPGYFNVPIDENLLPLISRFPRLFHGCQPSFFSHLVPGWAAVIDRLFHAIDAAISDEEAGDIHVLTIKEKAGGLRVHVGFGDAYGETPEDWPKERVESRARKHDELYDLIHAAQREADRTCSFCGEPGHLRLLMDESPVAPDGFLNWPADGKFTHGGTPAVTCDFHAVHKNRFPTEK